MKKMFFFIIVILISASSIKAQTTSGKDFWLTFGYNHSMINTLPELQIRIVSEKNPTTGTINFTNLGTEVLFNMGAYEVFTYPLNNIEKEAVYNTIMGKSNRTIHINSSESVKVYALNQRTASADATNIFPIGILSNYYYQISYIPFISSVDAYAVVAVHDNTQLYHNGDPVETLDAGEVYYRTSLTDMTGNHITANHPVAFFAVNTSTVIPINSGAADILFQQLPPVNTWGKNFFVPVSNLTKDRVRIVASQDNTAIIQTGGIFIFSSSGNYTLNAGQYIELEALLTNNGCYINADKPVGVCTYLTGCTYNGLNISDPAQAWLPPVGQYVSEALIAPFYPTGNSRLTEHYALVVTATTTKENTQVSIDGAPPAHLSGGTWSDHTSGYSFYTMPLNDNVYHFTNNKTLMIMGYGTGTAESYYYLAGSAMRNLSAAFTANNISYNQLHNHPLCEHDITFFANVDGIHPNAGSLNWYINGVHQPTLTDQLTWSQNFATGNHVIKMSVVFVDNSTETYQDTLKIRSCEAAFYANNVHHTNLPDTTFCDNLVHFQAEVSGLHPDIESLKWFIDGNEVTVARDQLIWSKTFDSGEHTMPIKMWVRYENGETETFYSTINVRVFWTKIRNVRY